MCRFQNTALRPWDSSDSGRCLESSFGLTPGVEGERRSAFHRCGGNYTTERFFSRKAFRVPLNTFHTQQSCLN